MLVSTAILGSPFVIFVFGWTWGGLIPDWNLHDSDYRMPVHFIFISDYLYSFFVVCGCRRGARSWGWHGFSCSTYARV